MNRTEDSPQHAPDLYSYARQSRPIRSYLFLVALVVLVTCCQAKETVLLSSLPSKNDKILLGILKETNYLLQSQKIIKGKKYQCLTIIKNDLLKNKVWTYQPIQYSITYLDLIFYQASLISGQIFEEKDKLLNFRLAKILSPLTGLCVYYRTTTFLTEYCHLEHVRQYDDDYTKYYNQKPAYEDFNLGKFQDALGIAVNPEQQPTKEEPVPNLPPKLSDFSNKYRHSFLDKIGGQPADYIEVQEQKWGKLLHSNAPIVSNSSYLQQYPVFAAIECKQAHTGKKIFNLGLVVNPFDVVYTKKEGVCVEHGQLRAFNASIKYDHLQEVRVYRQFMFGKVEETCTKKWNWQREGKPFQYARLKPGSTLFIEYYDGKTKKHYNKIVTIKKVHHPELIELDEELGSSFPTKRKTLFDKANDDIATVTELNRCELLFDKSLSKTQKTDNNQYVSNGIMMLNESILVSDEMNRLGCICQLQKDVSSVYKIDMDVTVGNKLWGNYYRVYFTTNQKIYLQRQFRDVLFSECKTITCHRYEQLKVDQQIDQIKGKGFTQIVDLNEQHKLYNVSSEGLNNIYVLNIYKGGVIRLVTVDSEGNQYVYLLSEGQLLKIRQFQNGTKEIEKQNSFYENATRYSDETIYNTLHIYCFKLPNGSYYGGIWKHRQYLPFPRMRMPGERIKHFELSTGYAYIRKLDLTLMEKPALLPLTIYAQGIKQQYLWDERSNYHEQRGEELDSMFLNQSYSINFTYTGGDYCGAPINQHRQTTVTLKCGGPWYQISEIRETKPCTYWIEVETLLLCEENFKIIVQQDDEIPNKTELDKIIASGVVCTKKEGLFDEGHTLLYPGKKMLSSK